MCPAACARKVRYDTRKQAKAAMVRLRAAGISTKGRWVYRCPYCGYFYIGNTAGRPRWWHRVLHEGRQTDAQAR